MPSSGLLFAGTDTFDKSATTTKLPDAGFLPQKPVWLTDLSLGIKESYDDDVYLTGVDQANRPIPQGGVLTLKNYSSWITTLSPKVGFNFAPLLGDQDVLQVLSFGYAPDIAIYHDASSESYTNHRFNTTIKGKSGDFSFNLDNSFNFIDGSKYGPSYTTGLSAYATAGLRERREQFQDRDAITLKYDQKQWFVRPIASLLYYDLQTKQLAGFTGYQNYPDRYDVNGGVDFGYKLNKDLAATLGYRYGSQYQQMFSSAIDTYGRSASSDYQRLLFGIEGKPFNWLEVKIQGGPDFRKYDSSAPVNNDSMTTYYGEATLTATLSKQDTLSFYYRQWQWVSSTGEMPYFDSTYDLNYKHKFNDKLSANLEGRLLGSDYTSGDALSGPVSDPIKNTNARNDLQYTVSAGVQYAFNANVSANLTYSYDLGRNAEDGLSDTVEQQRQYDRQIITIGAQVKF
jgi:opacity protein-like surface antigen